MIHKKKVDHWNKHQQKQRDKENRTCIDSRSVDVSDLPHPRKALQVHQVNPDKQNQNSVPSSQSSPSTAVRSIVSNLVRRHAFPPPSPPKTNKRVRAEGIYGEEITLSNRLDELKEKISTSNPAKRVKRSSEQSITTSTSPNGGNVETTNKRTRKLPKRTNETISSWQAICAGSTIQTPTSTVITSD